MPVLQESRSRMLFSELSAAYWIGVTLWLTFLVAGASALLGLRRRRKAQHRSLRGVHALLSLVTFLAGLSVVELYFALCCDVSDSLNMTNISQRWTKRHVRLNPQGFRDRKPFSKETGGRRRIAFLGDSFTFGQGVNNNEDRFSDCLARELEQTRPGQFEVSNLGVQGAGLPQLNSIIEKAISEKYPMEVVVYVVCLNDIDRYYSDIAQLYQRMEPSRPSFFLFRDTYFFNLLYIHAQQFTIPELRLYRSMLLRWYDGEEWTRMQQGLRHLRDTCRSANVDLRIAIFPLISNLGPDNSFREVHKQIAAYSRELGLRTLDLEPVLEPHAHTGLAASFFDEHPSARAHRLAADALRESLLSDLFHDPQ